MRKITLLLITLFVSTLSFSQKLKRDVENIAFVINGSDPFEGNNIASYEIKNSSGRILSSSCTAIKPKFRSVKMDWVCTDDSSEPKKHFTFIIGGVNILNKKVSKTGSDGNFKYYYNINFKANFKVTVLDHNKNVILSKDYNQGQNLSAKFPSGFSKYTSANALKSDFNKTDTSYLQKEAIKILIDKAVVELILNHTGGMVKTTIQLPKNKSKKINLDDLDASYEAFKEVLKEVSKETYKSANNPSYNTDKRQEIIKKHQQVCKKYLDQFGWEGKSNDESKMNTDLLLVIHANYAFTSLALNQYEKATDNIEKLIEVDETSLVTQNYSTWLKIAQIEKKGSE